MTRRRSCLHERPVSLQTVNSAVAALLTVTAVPLIDRALPAAETGTRVGPGTWVALALGIYAINQLLLGLTVFRWSYRVVLPGLLLLHAVAVYFSAAYGVVIDPSMMRNVAVTDWREAIEYLTPVLALVVLVGALLPSVIVWRLRVPRMPTPWSLGLRGFWLLVWASLLLLMLISAFDGLASMMRGHKHVRYFIAPANVLVASIRVLIEAPRGKPTRRTQISHAPRQAPHPENARPHVLVLVVGETARAANWGLNGYRRQTTPELARRQVINFPDVTACGTSTEVSVPCLFSVQGRHNYDARAIATSESLLHLLNRAGVAVAWRDNQTGCKGVCTGLPFESFRGARNNALCEAGLCRDEVLLTDLKARLQALRSDAVIVLHPLGNHGPAYFRRYGPELRRFTPDCRTADLTRCTDAEIVNAYDNALLATDRMLGRTIDLLASMPQIDSAMLYVSDHGESLGENGLYLHGVPQAIAPDVQMKVPMVLWLSQGMRMSMAIDAGCVRSRAKQPAEHDNVFHTVLGLMDVHIDRYERSHDLLAECRQPTRWLAPALRAAAHGDT
jgi:lipid A ethanolaminephosphotransferase